MSSNTNDTMNIAETLRSGAIEMLRESNGMHKEMLKEVYTSINSLVANMRAMGDDITASQKRELGVLVGKFGDIIHDMKTYNDQVDQIVRDSYASKEDVSKLLNEIHEYEKLRKEIASLHSKKNATNDNDEKQRIDNQLSKLLRQKSNKKSVIDSLTQADPNLNYAKRLIYTQHLNRAAADFADKCKDANEAAEQLTENFGNTIPHLQEMKKQTDLIVKGMEVIWGLVKSGNDMWNEVDDATIKYGRTLGLTLDESIGYRKRVLDSYSDIAAKYGMTFAEIQQFQEKYNESTGRAIQLTNDQVDTIASISKFASEEATNTIMSNMDNFGGSAEFASLQLAKTFKDASALGLNAQKTSKAFANNIMLASKYTFKGGLDSIERMTLSSETLKYNMASIATAAEKFETIEDAITNSAKLQVLGGNMAMQFGNPLEAMSMAMTDMEGFQNKVLKSFEGKAFWNSQKGMMDMSAIDKRFLKEQANILGISYDEAYNMATQKGKHEEISAHMSGMVADKTNQDFLKNRSYFDISDQEWKVSYTDEDGDEQIKSIAELTDSEVEMMRKRSSKEDAMAQDVNDILGLLKTQYKDAAQEYKSYEEAKKGIKNGAALKMADLLDPIKGIWKRIVNIFTSSGAMALFGSLLGNSLVTGGGLIKGPLISNLAKGAVKHGGNIIRGGGNMLAGAWSKVKNPFTNFHAPNIGNGASRAFSGVRTGLGKAWTMAKKPFTYLGGKMSGLFTGGAQATAGTTANAGRGILGGVLSKGAAKALGGAVGIALGGYEAYQGMKDMANAKGNYNNAKANVLANKGGGYQDSSHYLQNGQSLYDATVAKNTAKSNGAMQAVGGLISAAGGAVSLIPGVGLLPGMALTALGTGISALSSFGKDIKDAVFGKSEDEQLGVEGLAQKNFEREKVGFEAIAKMNGEEIKLQAAVATIGIHDLLISWRNKEDGLLENGMEESHGFFDLLGFAKGGEVPEPKNPIKAKNGDNVLATLKSGERVLSVEDNERFQEVSKSLGMFANPLMNTIMPSPIGTNVFEKVLTPFFGGGGGNNTFNGSNIDVNINGTLRLESNGQSARMDVRELLNDATFKQQLMKLVMDEINAKQNQGRSKNKNSKWGITNSQISSLALK